VLCHDIFSNMRPHLQEAAIKAVSEEADEEKKAALDELCRSMNNEHQRQLQEKEREFSNHLAAVQGQLTVSHYLNKKNFFMKSSLEITI
jgi:hypothetical protein